MNTPHLSLRSVAHALAPVLLLAGCSDDGFEGDPSLDDPSGGLDAIELDAPLVAEVGSVHGENLVDFQADGDGLPLGEGTAVTTQYSAIGIDDIYLVGTALPAVIAAPGCTFYGYANSCDGDDVPDADAAPAVSGMNQLTSTQYSGGEYSTHDYGFEFAQPVSEVSLRTVDFGDCVPEELGDVFTVDLVGYDDAGVEVARGTTNIDRYVGGCPDDGFVGTLSVTGSGIVRVETEGLEIDCAHAIDDLTFTVEDDGMCPSLDLGGEYDVNWYTGGARGSEQGTHGVGPGECPAGYVAVGIKYYDGGYVPSDQVDGVGIHCRELTIDPATDTLVFGDDHYGNWYMGGPRGSEQGTHGGDPGTGECPEGSIVVGMQYFEGGNSDWVDGVAMHCQHVEWNGSGFTFGASDYTNWYTGGPRGAEQGTHGVGLGDCSAGQVVTGMQYFEGDDWVDGVGMRCRDLTFFDDACGA